MYTRTRTRTTYIVVVLVKLYSMHLFGLILVTSVVLSCQSFVNEISYFILVCHHPPQVDTLLDPITCQA